MLSGKQMVAIVAVAIIVMVFFLVITPSGQTLFESFRGGR